MSTTQAEKRVLVKFWAPWCGPCKTLTPVVDELKEDGVWVEAVNIDERARVAQNYGIMSVPTLILIENGKEIKRTVGARPKDFLDEWIQT